MSDEKSSQRLYLGLDLSLQQLKGIVIDEQLNVIAEEVIKLDDQSLLVHYYVQSNGFVNPLSIPVLVFLEALDVLFQKFRDQKKFDFDNILGISGCAQQHGCIYWKKKNGLVRLKNVHSNSSENTIEISDIHQLPKNLFLIDLLKSSFSLLECPVSTDVFGTNEKLRENLFHSIAYERSSADQMIKIFKETPDIYEQTECIQLLSNFLASILLGDYAPIDICDASRMNIFDIYQHKWSKEYLTSYGKDFDKKLSDEFVYSRTKLGTIAKYFIERYGFNPSCQIISFTGDQLSSYYALALDPKTVVINLDSSDTVMASIPLSSIPKERFYGYLFINPLIVDAKKDLLMLLLYFKNGANVRERVLEEVASKDWQQMSELLCQTPPSNHGYLGYFFDDSEILPENLRGRFYFNSNEQQIESLAPASKARALLEGQCLAKRLYLQRANIDLVNNVDRIVITGGASVNIDFVQILADVFGKPVHAALASNSSCLGGALRAIDVVNQRLNSKTSTIRYLLTAQPRSEYISVYDNMLIRYAKIEDKILRNIY